MKDEAKIIAKTHSGEAILTVDKDTSNDDYFLTSGILEKTKKNLKKPEVRKKMQLMKRMIITQIRLRGTTNQMK